MASASERPVSKALAADAAFIVDDKKLDVIKAEKPWMKDVKYFKTVKVSAVAAMKMANHAAAGVEKGLKSSNHMPIEVMGLMQGHIDTETPGCLIVTDVFPLPVEGTETTVMSDNQEVMNYMIRLGESLESTRQEHFMGWYHSHPFDVGVHSNCFLSATDVSTQLSWQLSEDRAGNPWLALVVDPLRGVAKGKPEIGAFRCYPPSHVPPKGTAPDGTIWADERARNARWGESCVSYYQLETEYFMSSASSALMGIIARDFMWTRILSSTPMLDQEARDRLPERIQKLSDKVERHRGDVVSGAIVGHSLSGAGPAGASTAAAVISAAGFGASMLPASRGGKSSGGSGRAGQQSGDIVEAAVGAAELAGELIRGQAAQLIKRGVFENQAMLPLGTSSLDPELQALSDLSIALDSAARSNAAQ